MQLKQRHLRLLPFLPGIAVGCKPFSSSTDVAQEIQAYQFLLICTDNLNSITVNNLGEGA
ncbi:hypothetical protein [Nodularia sp. UHCC 0506]|uniref:hypothetical protein n=1 Tax=Nodularia sp. UHCC 0506 TaxID=3110243 RepID=UPI002B20C839|nr:hypothetical protein [Nodularia sp. UHCC 0506]MEA5515774.1 hypothetical protein [Nodularia sp. UHCC 0506]